MILWGGKGSFHPAGAAPCENVIIGRKDKAARNSINLRIPGVYRRIRLVRSISTTNCQKILGSFANTQYPRPEITSKLKGDAMVSKNNEHFQFPLILAAIFTAMVLTSSVGLAAGVEPVALSDAARTGNWESVRSLIASGAKGDVVNAP